MSKYVLGAEYLVRLISVKINIDMYTYHNIISGYMGEQKTIDYKGVITHNYWVEVYSYNDSRHRHQPGSWLFVVLYNAMSCHVGALNVMRTVARGSLIDNHLLSDWSYREVLTYASLQVTL